MATATSASVPYAIFLLFMIAFNLVGNSLVCLLILKNKAMKTSINWLLFHLAVVDLLVAVFFIPPCVVSHFIEHPDGMTGDILCKLITGGNLGLAAVSTSSFLLVAVAFERYYATIHPFQSLCRRRSPYIPPLLSFLGVLLAVPMAFVSFYDTETKKCDRNWPNCTAARVHNISWSFCNAMVPACIMGYLYARIILHLRKHKIVPGSSRSVLTESRAKVTKMLISVTIVFTACWIPQSVLCLISYAIPGGYTTVHLVSTTSALLNSSLNPVVYSFHSQRFRKNLASLLCLDKKKHSPTKNIKTVKITAISLEMYEQCYRKSLSNRVALLSVKKFSL